MTLKINKQREINKPKTGYLTTAKPLAKLPKRKKTESRNQTLAGNGSSNIIIDVMGIKSQ